MTDQPQPDVPEPTGPEATTPAPPGEAPSGAADPAPGGEGDDVSVETLLEDLERVAAERDQYLDATQRALADFDNFRKQSQRRQEEAVQQALSAFVERLLPALDACDAALAHGAVEVEPVLNALYQALEKEGLARVSPAGEPFDPNVAEAVAHEPGGGGPQVVSEVLRTGYTWNGRVLRAAMVKVTD